MSKFDDVGLLLLLSLAPAVRLRSLPNSGDGGCVRGAGGACGRAGVNVAGLGGAGHLGWGRGCGHVVMSGPSGGRGPAITSAITAIRSPFPKRPQACPPARFEAGPGSPAPIGPKAEEGRPMGVPEGPTKSGGDRGGPCRSLGGRCLRPGGKGGYA